MDRLVEQNLNLNGWNKPISAGALLKSLLEVGTVTIQHGERGYQVMKTFQKSKKTPMNFSVIEKELDDSLAQMWVKVRQAAGTQGGA